MSLKLKSKDEIMEEIIRLHNLILSKREQWADDYFDGRMRRELFDIEIEIKTLCWVIGCNLSKLPEVPVMEDINESS